MMEKASKKKGVGVALPPPVIEKLDALASQSGASRSQIVSELLAIALPLRLAQS